MTSIKKVITFLICLALPLAMMFALSSCKKDDSEPSSDKTESKASEGLEYTLSYDGTYSVTGIGTCTDSDIIIPETYEGKSVTSIRSYAFSGCSSLTSITIPDSVTSIGDYAFENCTSLTSVTIPDSVTSIGDDAFDGCNNLAYNEYDNCYYLGNDENPYLVLIKARDTSVTSCTINENTKIILDDAFYYCTSLTSITIPDSVTSIGSYAFWGCDSLAIYCEAQSKPSGWDSYWNVSNCPVVWGHAHSYQNGSCVCGKTEE